MSFSLRAAARQRPHADAILVDGRAISYRELAERAAAAMERLAALPPHPAARVALVARPDLASVTSLLALVELRRPVVLLHPRSTSAEHAALLHDAPAALLLDGARIESIEGSPPAAGTDSDGAEAGGSEHELAVLATSGSTGRPRAVSLSHRAFEAAAQASEANLGRRDDDRWLLALPFAHVGGLSVILRSLRARTAVVLATPDAGTPSPASSPAALREVVLRDRVTLLSLVPTQLHRLLALDAAATAMPSLRAVLVGGAAASPLLLERARSRGLPVLATYGLTESCAQAATQRPGAPTSAGCGPPLPGVELRITPDGAIALRGPSLLSGYLAEGALRPALDGDGWLVTRDAGRLDERGHLHVLGRLDDVIVTAGEKVHPTEVEQALGAIAGVEAACVFAVADEERGAVVAAAVVCAAPLAPEALAAAVAPLSPWKRPRLLAVVEALALGPSGKVDRRRTAEAARPRLTPCG